jgi:hypothetical protein
MNKILGASAGSTRFLPQLSPQWNPVVEARD